MPTTTVTQIVSFILRYRQGGNAFVDEEPGVLANCIQLAIQEQCCVVWSDYFGDIHGIIVAKSYPEQQRIHIYGLLANGHNAIAHFARWLTLDLKKDWSLTMTRHGRYADVKNTKQFLERIIKFYER